MRRIALLGLTLLLTGCAGFDHFVGDTFSPSANPNAPAVGGATMLRAMGQNPDVPALVPESGNIWPGPPPPEKTLLNVMDQPGTLGAPLGTEPNTGPGSPGLLPGDQTTLPRAPHPQPRPAAPASQSGLPSNGLPTGTTVTTPQGNGVVTGGTGGYNTLSNPQGGPNAIVVPNGNGTSTVINPDGSIQNVPTPK